MPLTRDFKQTIRDRARHDPRFRTAAPTKYWFSNLPEGVSQRRLVRLAKLRWRVEQNYHQLK